MIQLSLSQYTKIVFLLCVLLIYSCKEQVVVTPINYEGKTLQSIESNIIRTEDSMQIVLEEDSISKIFYLVRHAEKDTTKGVTDPVLTEAGLLRATKLADIMRGTRVDIIYSTLTTRALYTVDSLADIKSMVVKPYDNKMLKSTIEEIKNSEDNNRIFIVGHSNTIPSITNSLTGKEEFNKVFSEDDYGNFVIVVLNKNGTSDVYKLRY